MECYPPCPTCTGLCKTPVPARRVVPSSGTTTVPKPKKPVAPVHMPGYLVFLCGHYDTAENQRVVFSLLKKRFPSSYTRSTKFWCEKCQKWTKPYTASDKKPEEATGKLEF